MATRAGAVDAPVIMMAAGDPSGDMHGAAVAREIRRRWPDAELFGIGGARMAAEGVELLADPDRLAVMGFVEILADLPFFYNLLRTLRAEMERRGADLVIPIDYPGLNLRLAKAARAARIPVLYYIAPQVWAWHRSRAAGLAAVADELAVVLPFEQAIFEEYGARTHFVGHPLMDEPRPDISRADFCAKHGLDPARPIMALFPGSRQQEVERHLELFTAAAREVTRAQSGVQPVIAATAGHAKRVSDAGLPVTTAARELLAHARAAIVKSGTSTLEAAVADVPMVVSYRTHPLTFALARQLVDVPHVGLVNLVAGERLAPELLQDDATPSALARAVLPLLDDGPRRDHVLAGLERVREALRAPGGSSAAERVVALAERLIIRGAV